MSAPNSDQLLVAMLTSTTPSTKFVTFDDFKKMGQTSQSAGAFDLKSFHDINLISGPVALAPNQQTPATTTSTSKIPVANTQTVNNNNPNNPTSTTADGPISKTTTANNNNIPSTSKTPTDNGVSTTTATKNAPSTSQHALKSTTANAIAIPNSNQFQASKSDITLPQAVGIVAPMVFLQQVQQPIFRKIAFCAGAILATKFIWDYFNNPKPKLPSKFPLHIKTLTGINLKLICTPGNKVFQVKSLILKLRGIAIDKQILIFRGKHLQNGKTLKEYKIFGECVLQLTVKLSDLNVIYLPEGLRDPAYDWDFSDVMDNGMYFKRGGFDYKRPVGCLRLALNVLGLYGDDIWLGSQDRIAEGDDYTKDVVGEWPVSYHGTGKHNLQSIAEKGYDLSKGKRFLFGRGIYTTPDLHVALRYASTFTFRGAKYKFVLQNRVNPATLKIVTQGQNSVGEYWVNEKQEDVRPYGICIVKGT